MALVQSLRRRVGLWAPTQPVAWVARPQMSSMMMTTMMKTAMTPSRSLVYVKDGVMRARGLKKDESEYLTVNGTTYPGNDDTLHSTKQFLGPEYGLPDSLILQAITHKSFAHGKKPFNEKLAILGREFLRLQASTYAVSRQSANPHAINTLNFDISPASVEVLSSSSVLYEICKRAGVDKHVFWKSRSSDPNVTASASGERTVFSRCIAALVGAVLLRHGEPKARQFVADKLFSGPYSVISISKEIFAPR